MQASVSTPSPLSPAPAAAWAAAGRLPAPLAPLAEIALNLWWSWTPRAAALFERIDAGLWQRSGHNPAGVLIHVPADRLEKLGRDQGFVAEMKAVHGEFAAYMSGAPRFNPASGTAEAAPQGFKVAYFCAEFGLAECFQIYCGGLGLLAGDHLKSAAELGLPLVGVGLLYSHGYFHQKLDRDGVQHELTPSLEPDEQPIRRVIDPATGVQRKVRVELPGRSVAVGIWRCDVGTVPLYLLDTNLPENTPEDRGITRNLYLGDHHQRIKQELVLGVGGVRALQAVGERPTVYHMNEGHAAFLALERIRAMREATAGRASGQLTFDQVREGAAAAHVFTTHTPLPAGIDRFHPELIKTYLSWMLPGLGLDTEGLLALGRERVEDREEAFSMAVLAIRASRWCNGVSRLHGEVSREMWRRIWPGAPVHDVPIGHVTNGIHTATWVSPELTEVYSAALGERWISHPDDPGAWAGVETIPDAALWSARVIAKRRLVEYVRRRQHASLAAHGATPAELEAADSTLDENVLTIGFARRFAAYKRATLLLHDERRFERLLTGERPIQVLVAGKAHPGDHGGKQLIRDLVEFAKRAGVSHRLVFIDDYDIDVARHLVQGVDIWLNNPIRGLEASGTSGMKAALNGAINMSILDGWWDEAFEESLGFAIGGRTTTPATDPALRDAQESQALYSLLEDRVIPEYYARSTRCECSPECPTHETDGCNLPRAWLARMKRCIRVLAPRFSTHRMVAQYATDFYIPAHRAWQRLAADGLAPARALSDAIDRYRRHWRGLRILDAVGSIGPAAPNGSQGASVLGVRASIDLGGLSPDEVLVQAYLEQAVSLNHLPAGQAIAMSHEREHQHGAHTFAAAFEPSPELLVSPVALRIRVLPRDERLITPFVPGLLTSAPVRPGSGDNGHGPDGQRNG